MMPATIPPAIYLDSGTVIPFYFGEAHMSSDGTIVFDSLYRSKNGSSAEGRRRFAITDPEYKNVLRGLGGMKPGEERVVPPWHDEAPKAHANPKK